MKTYSIGRDIACDIVINDNTDVISRRHAVLKVEDNGSMTITDISSNGTYINGIRMNSNEPVPVKRSDNVSFAHVANLDWSRVPATTKKKNYLMIGIVVLLAIAAIVTIISLAGHHDSNDNQNENNNVIATDSISNKNDSVTVSVDSLKNDTSKLSTTDKQKNTVKAKETKEIKAKDTKDSKKGETKDNKDPNPAKRDTTAASKRPIG